MVSFIISNNHNKKKLINFKTGPLIKVPCKNLSTVEPEGCFMATAKHQYSTFTVISKPLYYIFYTAVNIITSSRVVQEFIGIL